jgi:signal transduction histidine kinase
MVDIVLATCGKSGVSLALTERPDVILLDVMMPELDGYATCRLLQADPATRHIPVILLTALSGRDEVLRGLEAGAVDFLTKPVSGVELRARVAAMARLKRMRDELDQANRVQRELLHMLVHDFRSPLAALHANLWSMRKAFAPDSPHAESLGDARNAAQRLVAMVGQMVAIGQADRRNVDEALAQVAVHEQIQAAARLLRPLAQLRQVKVVVAEPDAEASASWVRGDAQLLQRAVENLLSNAIKYTEEGTSVELSLHRVSAPEGSRLQFAVADRGPGVPVADRERIFARYATLPQNSADVPQLGLGLAFCRFAAQVHGGLIHVADRPDGGATFTLDLPCGSSLLPAESPRSATC